MVLNDATETIKKIEAEKSAIIQLGENIEVGHRKFSRHEVAQLTKFLESYCDTINQYGKSIKIVLPTGYDGLIKQKLSLFNRVFNANGVDKNRLEISTDSSLTDILTLISSIRREDLNKGTNSTLKLVLNQYSQALYSLIKLLKDNGFEPSPSSSLNAQPR